MPGDGYLTVQGNRGGHVLKYTATQQFCVVLNLEATLVVLEHLF